MTLRQTACGHVKWDGCGEVRNDDTAHTFEFLFRFNSVDYCEQGRHLRGLGPSPPRKKKKRMEKKDKEKKKKRKKERNYE